MINEKIKITFHTKEYLHKFQHYSFELNLYNVLNGGGNIEK